MSDLDGLILAKIEESGNKINDYDQRSALGMARSWVDNGKLDVWDAQRHKDMIQYPNRDALAADLVAILEGKERDDQIEALQVARKHINEPFLDPTMLGQQNRKPTLKPGDKKKGEKGEK